MNSTKYITSKIDCQSYCKINGQFTRHLREHNITFKDYYETYETHITPLCYCLRPLTFYQKDNSYANSCGDPKCVGMTISHTKKNWTDEQRSSDKTNKQYAASLRTPEQIAQQVAKASATFKEKYGVEWATQSDEYKTQSRKTKLAKYGNEFYAGWEKSAARNRAKSIDEQNEINNKRRETNLDRYGVEHTLLLPSTISKINKGNSSIKEYTMPSKKIIGIRGYENLALDVLLTQYDEMEITIHDDFSAYQIQTFKYDGIDRVRTYYPDIFIAKDNLIIEVKSQWWWDGNGSEKYVSRLSNNMSKRQSVLDEGYRYQVWLFSNKYTHRILEHDTDF